MASGGSGWFGRRALTRALVCLLVFGFVPEVWAGGFTLSTFGARRNGMQTNMAAPDDVTAIFHNPAGLADQGGYRIHTSIGPTFLKITFNMRPLNARRYPEINPAGCGEPGHDPCPWPVNARGFYDRNIQPERTFGFLPFIGAAFNLGRTSKKLKDVTIGISVNTPQFYGAFLPEGAPSAYYIIGGYFLVIATTVGVGWRINEKIAIGMSFSYNYLQLQLSQRLSIIDALSPDDSIDPTAEIAQNLLGDVRLDYTGTDHGFGWTFGLLLNPTPWFSFGASYYGATPAVFSGRIKFSALGPGGGEPLVPIEDALRAVNFKLPRKLRLSFPIPQALRMGVNFHIGRHVEFGVDMRIWFYEVYKQQTLTPVYDPDEPGDEPLSREGLSRSKDYRNSWQCGFGFLLRPIPKVRGFEFMTGYSYDRSPIPDHTFTMDNPSLDIHRLTMGIRWRINWHWRLAFTYFVNFWVERDITNSQTNPPTNIKGKGISHTPSFELEAAW